VRQQRALRQEEAMIAKQRHRRHSRRQTAQRRHGVRVQARLVARLQSSEVGSPRKQPLHHVGKPRFTFVLAAGVDARGKLERRRQAFRLR
jgi:hypothetical protein